MTTIYPPAAFQFSVRVGDAGDEAQVDAAFQEVSGIGVQMDTDTVVEGGENRFVHQLPKAMKPGRLVLKRGLAVSGSRLASWCEQVLQDGLCRPIRPQLLVVSLLDGSGEPRCTWKFGNSWPVQWDVDPFVADRNGVAIEKIELAYSGCTRVR